MREYDDNIRLYTPILQRIIILVAVIVAVPVVLWTITAFVRAYVGPPRLPIFRPIAADITIAPQRPVQVAAQTFDPAIATDARASLLEIKRPAASQPPQPTAAMPASALSAPPISAPAMSVPAMPAPSATPATTPPSPVADIAAPVVVPPQPFGRSHVAPAPIAASATAALANVVQPVAPASSGSAVSVPADSAADDQTAASSGQMASNDSAAGDLSSGTPLHGKIPLPLRRPSIAAPPEALSHDAARVAQIAAPAAANVPLPRARPASAPDPAPVEQPSYPSYDPSQIH
jgi:hypothetical protein